MIRIKGDRWRAVYGWCIAALNVGCYVHSGSPAHLAVGSVVAFVAVLYTFGGR